ncbi:uncharacterized protein Z520_02136 [Fonsecaea multimorphosa CBS 102226]|uniref:Sas10 C-terminal domain-containing protein n=1 Tax=Fonsecaea multimorphosa CBS 102226 TaxID=1442371 RepID=A0A0D2K7L0_9EURO|nr:uncharacterized protein Z520_02136 [Fonsecaea multimorphosa CBS 102226]KIY01998.1 hypothetical protein Z520_02136 [Fonsecaea multimorphosa CBS 102226]OAL29679.1 hypothetical protein AYO22_02093 [Fonsecaea multimorphosa]
MAKKRKAVRVVEASGQRSQNDLHDAEETFNDSEDEFFAGRDKVLLDEGPAAKRRRKIQEQERELEPSDEEVYQDLATEDESEDYDDNTGHPEDDREEEEDDGHWGTSKADYYSADVIETEADALEEEQEARRLQLKQLKAMTEADFGFDESAWVGDNQQSQEKRSVVEKLPELQISQDASIDERIKILKSRYPEFEPLTKDFLSLQDTYQSLRKEADVEGHNNGGVTVTKFRALSAYLGAVAMYLALLTSTKTGVALAPGELRDHPVMSNLFRCRQLWQDAESLRPIDPIEKPETKPPTILPQSLPQKTARQPVKKKTKTKPASPETPSPEIPMAGTKSKKAKKPKRNELQELLTSSLRNPTEEESDFGDEAPLTHEEAAEKARRKKTLRFYTSQIAQKANKRGAASRQAGGDDDLPYKERNRDRQERLMREAEQRGRATANEREELDDDDDDDPEAGRRINDEANEYYDMLVTNAKQKKADKRAKAEAYAEAARQGAQVYEEEQVGPDGKRKITYAIEKNKGLTPKRKKEVRNPRVKKRKKFDEKMKKLASIRPVYKGGEGRGGYGGEATGIKTNLVKSIKL